MKHNMAFHNQCDHPFPPMKYNICFSTISKTTFSHCRWSTIWFSTISAAVSTFSHQRSVAASPPENWAGTWNWKLATVSSVDAQWQSWVRSPDSGVVLDKKVAEEVKEDMNEQERSTYRWQNHWTGSCVFYCCSVWWRRRWRRRLRRRWRRRWRGRRGGVKFRGWQADKFSRQVEGGLT